MKKIVFLFVSLFSVLGQASTSMFMDGRSTNYSGAGVVGYSSVLKISGQVSEKEAGCEQIVKDAVDRFGNTAELSSTMTFDYLYACMFGSFVVQVLIEPRTEKNIPEFLKYMEQRNTGYFYKQPVKFLDVSRLEVDSRVVARHYVTRKKVDYRYDFTSSRVFVFENFAQYFAMKERERQVFWVGPKDAFVAHLQDIVDVRERGLVPGVVKQSNYFTQQFPMICVLNGGQSMQGFWIDGVFRDERKFNFSSQVGSVPNSVGERKIINNRF